MRSQKSEVRGQNEEARSPMPDAGRRSLSLANHHASRVTRHASHIRPSSRALRSPPFIALLVLLLTACAAQAQLPPTNSAAGAELGATAVVEATATLPEYLQVKVPTTNSNDPQRFTFPTPIVYPTPLNWRPPVMSVPLALRPEDHFWFARPIASDSVNYPLWTYRYGSTNFGAMNIHAGVDIDAPMRTPVLATGPGQIVWADWGLFYFTPGLIGDPYGIAVVIKHDFGYNDQTLYTQYGHMDALNDLYVGQRVSTGDVLGWVGVTGNTSGPHVHFEVRQKINDYFHTRNPELWMAPYAGWGVLAGQLLDAEGHPIVETPIEIYDERGRSVSEVYTYSARVANPDDEWRENFAISDLPEGTYYLRAKIANAEPIEGEVTVLAGQTNFVILQQGVGLTANALPAPSQLPPYPTNTPTDTPTPTSTPTPTNTRTPAPTRTPRPTRTPTPTRTPSPSPTPRVSPSLTVTPSPTNTP